MISLGIESTAHTFGIGVITSEGKVLVNVKDSYSSITGMVPIEVAKHHKEVKDRVLADALAKSDLKIEDVDLIVYSQGPGLSPCLRVGRDFAKELAEKHNRPIIGANHCVAHLTIGQLTTKTKDSLYLYVSGVNTQLLVAHNKFFRVLGETLDIGLGNALDKFGRFAGLGFPAGPKIEESAKGGRFVELPYAVKGMDVSFAGIITAAERLLKNGTPIADVCFSLQETCFAMLCEVAERGLAHTKKNELILIGGVGANKRLVEMLAMMCVARGVFFAAVPLEYAGDQGVMIAWQGLLEFQGGRRISEVEIFPYERTDEVMINWV